MEKDYEALLSSIFGLQPKLTGLSDLLKPPATPLRHVPSGLGSIRNLAGPIPTTPAVPTGEPYRGIRDLLGGLSIPAPVPTPEPLGIRFEAAPGTSIKFSEPTRFYNVTVLGLSPLIDGPGLYAILVPDNNWRPRQFRAIYIGQTKDVAERPTDDHEHFNDWCNAAGGEANLYVAYHWMYGSTKQQRMAVEKQLVDRYRPQCNWPYNGLGPLLSGNSF